MSYHNSTPNYCYPNNILRIFTLDFHCVPCMAFLAKSIRKSLIFQFQFNTFLIAKLINILTWIDIIKKLIHLVMNKSKVDCKRLSKNLKLDNKLDIKLRMYSIKWFSIKIWEILFSWILFKKQTSLHLTILSKQWFFFNAARSAMICGGKV